MFFIDSHCHLDKINYNSKKNIFDVIEESKSKNVKYILTVSTNLSDYLYLKNIIYNEKNIFFSCGIHPLNCNQFNEIKLLKKLTIDNKVIAIGETGLDFLKDNICIKKQENIFIEHIKISKNLNKPIIIHSRNSITKVINILKEQKMEKPFGVFHCYNINNIKLTKKILDMGYYISFSGIVTFKNSVNLRNTVKYIPIDRLLIETDSPWLSPVPKRGKENCPSYIKYIAVCISKIKNIKLDLLLKIISENFCNLFRLNLI